jgi:hypothetical protein
MQHGNVGAVSVSEDSWMDYRTKKPVLRVPACLTGLAYYKEMSQSSFIIYIYLIR